MKFINLLSVLLAILGALPQHAEGEIPAELQRLIPAQWSVRDIRINAIPYTFSAKPGQKTGVGVDLGGPTAEGVVGDADWLTLYFMPLDYQPIEEMTFSMPWCDGASVGFIGQNENFKIYFLIWTPKVKFWPTWKEDVTKHYRLKATQSRTSASSEFPTAPDFCGGVARDHASIAVMTHASLAGCSGWLNADVR